MFWAFRTTPYRSIDDTPYSLTYETEVIIPLEVDLPTLRMAQVEAINNDEAMEEVLDFAESRREVAAIYLANY